MNSSVIGSSGTMSRWQTATPQLVDEYLEIDVWSDLPCFLGTMHAIYGESATLGGVAGTVRGCEFLIGDAGEVPQLINVVGPDVSVVMKGQGRLQACKYPSMASAPV